MTLVSANAEVEAAPHRNRGRLWLSAVSLVMAAVGIAVAIWTLTYISTYEPLERGSFAGYRIGQAKDLTDGVADPSAIILTGQPRSTGGVMQSVDNPGKHAVRILGAEPGSLLAVHWLPGDPDGNKTWSALLKSAHPFPMTMRPGEEIGVFMMATKPTSCKGAEGITTMMSVDLRTESFGVHHDFTLSLESDFGNIAALVVCPEPKQLKYVSPFFG